LLVVQCFVSIDFSEADCFYKLLFIQKLTFYTRLSNKSLNKKLTIRFQTKHFKQRIVLITYCHTMKKIILLIFVSAVTIINGCKDKEQSGYNCNNGNCTAVFENPQYLSLSDCQSACGSSGAGYNCISGNCVSVSSNAQYSTLSACQSACSSGSAGYNCVSGNCVYVSSNAQYSNYSECRSACSSGGGGGTTGKVIITASWSNPAPWNACSSPYTVVIGLGYNSTDVANESYFTSSSFNTSPATFTKDGLTAGVYYYGAKKTFNASTCGTGQGIPPTVKKSGSFTIVAGQTTTVNGVSLN
jgi:hypothetical protein